MGIFSAFLKKLFLRFFGKILPLLFGYLLCTKIYPLSWLGDFLQIHIADALWTWLTGDSNFFVYYGSKPIGYFIHFIVLLIYFAIIGKLGWKIIKAIYTWLTEHIFVSLSAKIKSRFKAKAKKLLGKDELKTLPAIVKQAAEAGTEAGLLAGQQAVCELAYQQAYDEAYQKICAAYQAQSPQPESVKPAISAAAPE